MKILDSGEAPRNGLARPVLSLLLLKGCCTLLESPIVLSLEL